MGIWRLLPRLEAQLRTDCTMECPTGKAECEGYFIFHISFQRLRISLLQQMGEDELPLTLYPPTNPLGWGTFWGRLWYWGVRAQSVNSGPKQRQEQVWYPYFCKTCLVAWCQKIWLAYSAEVPQPQERLQLLRNNVWGSRSDNYKSYNPGTPGRDPNNKSLEKDKEEKM